MARKVHPIQDSKDEYKACKSYETATDITFSDLQTSLRILEETHSKEQMQHQTLSEDEANDLLSENIKMLDLCQKLGETLDGAKRFTEVLHKASRSFDALKAAESVSLATTSLYSRASDAISIAARCRFPRISTWEMRRLRSHSAVPLLKEMSQALAVSIPDWQKRGETSRLRSVFEKVLQAPRACAGVRELEGAHAAVTNLRAECSRRKEANSRVKGQGLLSSHAEQLKLRIVELEKGIAGLEQQLGLLYQALIRRQMFLLDFISHQ